MWSLRLAETGQYRPVEPSSKGRYLIKKIRNPSFLIRLIYALCLAGATYNHARIVAAYGIRWDYGGLPLFVCFFWTALTFIDPLAVVLLMARPTLGLALTVAIIASDVVINFWVGLTYGVDIASFLAQVLFLVFVMLTVCVAWRAELRACLSPWPGVTSRLDPASTGRCQRKAIKDEI
jgi:hypothetical protein